MNEENAMIGLCVSFLHGGVHFDMMICKSRSDGKENMWKRNC